MYNAEWAKTATAEEVVDSMVDILNNCEWEIRSDIVRCLAERADEKFDPDLFDAVSAIYDNREILPMIGEVSKAELCKQLHRERYNELRAQRGQA